MKMSRFLVVPLAVLASASWPIAAQVAGEKISFRSFTPPPGVPAERLQKIAEATAFARWPKPDGLAVAPEVRRTLLSRPELVTRETTSFQMVVFEGEQWGVARVAWQNLTNSDRARPNELPSELREKYLQQLTNEQRADPATVERYMARRLERYRAAHNQRLAGEMNIEVALGPSALAVQEYLLAHLADNMLPDDALVATYRNAPTPEGLGDRGWVTESRTKESTRIQLVRRNVVLILSARGSFVEEALPFARRFDGLIARQPALTREQLQSRRPTVTLAAEKTAGALRYSISAPADVQIADTLALVDGRTVRPRDRAVQLADVTGRANVRVFVITRELLVGRAQVTPQR